jgi:pyruvate formate lyase activating enzyme
MKHSDPFAHRKWTKSSNEQIISNLKLIAERETPVIIRIPLIPGVNDSNKELLAIAGMVKGILKEPRVNLLPYHGYGVNKYRNLDRRYRLNSLTRQSESEIQRAKEAIESSGIRCEIVL